MANSRIFIAAMFAIGLALQGCSNFREPIETVNALPFLPRNPPLTPAELSQRLIWAAQSLHWQAVPTTNGQIRAVLRDGSCVVTVDIIYDPTRCSIVLVSTENLGQTPNGEIEHRYNRWVNNLRRKIDQVMGAPFP